MFAASPNLIAGHSPLLGSLFRENPQRNFSCPVSCHPLPLPPSHKFKLCGKVHRSPRGVGVSLRASTQAQTCSPCSKLSKAPRCPESFFFFLNTTDPFDKDKSFLANSTPLSIFPVPSTVLRLFRLDFSESPLSPHEVTPITSSPGL